MSEENPNALKHMYDRNFLKVMGTEISKVWNEFDIKAFNALLPKLLELEMKPRVNLVREELYRQLPKDYVKALKILLNSLKGNNLSGFSLWPYTEYIRTYGLHHLELSLDAQKKITSLFTSEFSIRPYIREFPKETLKYLEDCAADKNEHIRRWASEGSRPRLPWGEKLHNLILSPELTLPILDKLFLDDSMYVRKSVANHLNDIAKDNPELVIKTLKRWQKLAKKEDSPKLEWITRHSLRTLIKQGDSAALGLIGVSSKVKIKISDFNLVKDHLNMNEMLKFSFMLKSLEPKSEKIVVDYKIHYQKAGGKLSEKVFKLKTITIQPKEVLKIEKSHHVKEVTTRVYYSGDHHLEILVNGLSLAKVKWKLKV